MKQAKRAAWEIGGYLSAKIKHEGWGKSTIDNLVDYSPAGNIQPLH